MAKTTRPMVRIHDLATNEIIDREMSDAEFAELQTRQEMLVVEKAQAEAKATAKSAILDRIGLTADELKTILG